MTRGVVHFGISFTLLDSGGFIVGFSAATFREEEAAGFHDFFKAATIEEAVAQIILNVEEARDQYSAHNEVAVDDQTLLVYISAYQSGEQDAFQEIEEFKLTAATKLKAEYPMQLAIVHVDFSAVEAQQQSQSAPIPR